MLLLFHPSPSYTLFQFIDYSNIMRLVPSVFLFFVSFLHLILLHSSYAHNSTVLCIDKEKQALLDFKLSFVADLFGVLSTWSIHNDDCCNWEGVTCDSGHVAALDLGEGLKSYELRPSLLGLQHLTTLSLSGNQFAMRIPKFIGSLSKLADLDLSGSGFFGEIPPYLGNLSRLQSLQLGPSNRLWADNLQWLPSLSSISYLDLSGVNLSNAIDLASTLKMLPNLYSFRCRYCSLPPPPLSSISPVNSTSLEFLDLSNNSVSVSTFASLINGYNNLRHVYLDHMKVEHYNIHGILEALTRRARDFLEQLSLVGNNLNKLPFEGMMFPSLMTLDVSFNRISASLPRILPYLPTTLTYLDFSSNLLDGVITDAHFSKFFQLQTLILSNNNLLVFNFSKSWVPLFQLETLHFASCKVGPTFPNWILTQKQLSDLDLSNSMISGGIPDAFWDFSTRISSLNLSHNNITCKIPNSLLSYVDSDIDLSSNAFYGPIPLFLFSSGILDLSYNRFSKLPPFRSTLLSRTPSEIYLSGNRLSGSLPNWLFQNDLLILNLANNMLSGSLPEEIGSSFRLFLLHLSNNSFSGQLPLSMKNCTQLTILELASNNFSGFVPFWLGESMPHLIALNLRSNNFFGDLPSSLCHLQSLQILDLSDNQISGPIPKCISNFTAMSTNKGLNLMGTLYGNRLSYTYENGYVIYLDYASVMWKGEVSDMYSRNLDQRSVINLSGNWLRGEIPIGVTTLKELRSLDLSRNGLNGSIPDMIGQLTFLELLKLSSNSLCGEIPESLADLTFLGTLDLSNNNLSGRIPGSTQLQSFDASSYGGNPKLCSEPLPTKCPGDEEGDDDTKQPLSKKDVREESFDIQAFLAALGAGFAFGLLGVLGTLHCNRRLRLAFFRSVHDIADGIFVTTSLCHSRIKRSLLL